MRFVGLNIERGPAAEENLKRKEQKWIGKVQNQIEFTSEERELERVAKSLVSGAKSPARVAASSSGAMGLATATVNTNSGNSGSRFKYGGESRRRRDDHTGSYSKNNNNANTKSSSKCLDRNISTEDLIMMGLYRLDEQQEQIYRNFVEMISGFDEYDKVLCNMLLFTSVHSFLCFD